VSNTASIAAIPAPAKAAPSPYFVNLPIDFLFIGGASIITYLLMWKFQKGDAGGLRTNTIINLGIYLSVVCNWPHFSATSFRLYGNKDHLRQYPVTGLIAPILVTAAVFGSFAAPTQIAPMFLKLFLIWSPYHFSGQSIGISLLYARRGGHKVDSLERFMLSGFIYGSFMVNSIRAEAFIEGYEYYGVHIAGFGVPEWTVTATEIWMYGCGAVLFFLLVARALRSGKLPPLMYLLPGITQYVWFVLGGYANHAGFAEFIPFFHSLQYLLIAWAMQMREKSEREKIVPTSGFVLSESVLWYAVNVIGGACLFYILPKAAIGAGISPDLANATIIAGVQIHHFFVDGVIWKLKSKSVVSPLLVNVPDMVRAAESPGLSGAAA